jgi:hypothetical protein
MKYLKWPDRKKHVKRKVTGQTGKNMLKER